MTDPGANLSEVRMIFEKKILDIYKKTLLFRRDPNGSIYYFDKSDFDGLVCEDLSFTGDKGQRLAAHIYYRGEKRYDRLIVFEHGMGCGHRAYMREINEITERGYTVFTYDHTGTLDSEGESIGGFSQSLADLDRAIGFVRSLDEYKDARIAVIGHSWGGFSTMNIPALHPDITHVVALSGFISPKAIQEQALSGLLRFYRKAVYQTEIDAFPDYYAFDGRTSLKGAKTRAMIIHSKDDATCKFDHHFAKLEEALSECENVELLALDGKRHNPNYSAQAVKLLSEFQSSLRAKNKKKELTTPEAKAAFVASFDWWKMTEQDKELWDRIFAFIEN